MQIFFVCDESGAKGYADVPEQYPGEAGVFAGYFILENGFEETTLEAAEIAQKYFATDEKCHLASLCPSKMTDLRNDIFAFIESYQIICTYEAIYVEGFKQLHDRFAAIAQEAQSRRTSPIRINNRVSVPSLHVQLFQGLFCKAVAFLKDNHDIDKDDLKILTDKIDVPILKEFAATCQEITNFGPSSSEVTGWNPEDNNLVKGKILTNCDLPEAEYGWIKQVKFEIIEASEPLAMVADVLANSLNYHFKDRQGHMVGRPLNVRSAVSDHELYTHFFGLDDSPQFGSSDSMYMHPCEEARRKISCQR